MSRNGFLYSCLILAPLALMFPTAAKSIGLDISNITTRGAGCEYGNAGHSYIGVVDIVDKSQYSIASFTFDAIGEGTGLKFLKVEFSEATKSKPDDTSVFSDCQIQFDLASAKRGQKFSLRFNQITNQFRWDDEKGMFDAIFNIRMMERGRPEGTKSAHFKAPKRGRHERAYFSFANDFITTCSEEITLKIAYNATLQTGTNGVKEESMAWFQNLGDLNAEISECS